MSGKLMRYKLQYWGDKGAFPGGVYVLRFVVHYELWLRIGRFNKGAPISFKGGEYLYVGSAMRSLAPRLVRHASRSWGLAPHRMRYALMDAYDRAAPEQKKLHWHIDYLMDQDDVELEGVFALHCGERLEKKLAGWALAQPETKVVVARLGASDHKMSTHLLRVEDGDAFWGRLGDWMEVQAGVGDG